MFRNFIGKQVKRPRFFYHLQRQQTFVSQSNNQSNIAAVTQQTKKHEQHHQQQQQGSSLFSSLLFPLVAGTTFGLILFENQNSIRADGKGKNPALTREQKEALKSPICEKADEMYLSNEMSKLHDYLKQQMEKQSNQCEIVWRYARACYKLAQEKKDPEKKKLIYEAYEVAQKAVELDEKSSCAQKWFGITISSVGDYESTKVQISNAYKIKEAFLKACEYDENDPTARNLLGVWCFTFADMSWVTRQIASTLFNTPPSSTYEEALEHFLKAEEIDPGFYKKNLLMIAKTYKALGNAELSKKYALMALEVAIKEEEDKESHEEAKKLL